MLDRATLSRLSRTPEKNAPMLNVALAQEGFADVLLALARSHAVGAEALDAVEARVQAEGVEVGRDVEAEGEAFAPIEAELDRLITVHPNASAGARTRVLARHAEEPFFVLAAACHPRAGREALERAAAWPSASPLHDRPWIALLDGPALDARELGEWAAHTSVDVRDAAARLAKDPALLDLLARDASRKVRRGVASNRAFVRRAELAASDPAVEVRARAAAPLASHGEGAGAATSLVESARFAAAYRMMNAGGLVAPDVVRAISSASVQELDAEVAQLAGRVLPRKDLVALLDRVTETDLDGAIGRSLAAGIALRAPVAPGSEAEDRKLEEAEHVELVADAVKSLGRTTTAESRLTGKARLAAWAAEGLAAHAKDFDVEELLDELRTGPLAASRMVFARAAAKSRSFSVTLCVKGAEAPAAHRGLPASLLETAWGEPSVGEACLLELAARVESRGERAEDLPDDEVDLDPSARPLEILERVVLTVTKRVNVSPRTALAAVALDARRVRYILAAMPQWKGRLTGGQVARVLRQHGAAITVAQAEARARQARIESWTDRLLSELELAVALAVGHLTGPEVARRVTIGRQAVDDGLALAAGADARAALEGVKVVQPLLEWATKHKNAHTAAFSIWLLLERFDRERASSLVASSLDALATTKGAVPPAVTDALAAIERRRPGRLEGIHPQSPRGRATLASAIARAYRTL